jgi:predicted GNAT family acetyltransferase
MSEYYSCKLDNQQQLIYYPSDMVRWLDINEDWERINEYFISISGRGILKNEIDNQEWKCCAYIEDGKILSYAGCLYMTDRNWEIGAVSTHPGHRNKGYAKMVCSFIAKYILENNKQATCNTDINNDAMKKVMNHIGMVIQ